MKNDIGMGKTIYICLSLRFECSDSDRDREEVRQHELSQRGLAELIAMNTKPIIICDEGRNSRRRLRESRTTSHIHTNVFGNLITMSINIR